MNEKNIIAMVGHTAAGKTTLAKYLSEKLDIPYISEGALKRSLKSQYVSENSLDETLRDQGYKMAIALCIELLSENDIVIIDASFHKLLRRIWLFDALNPQIRTNIIWIHCNCPNENEIRARLHRRVIAREKTAENQADQFYIYQYIKSNFDTVKIDDFKLNVGTAIVMIDTSDNVIVGIDKNACCSTSLLSTLTETILPNYLRMKH